MKARTSFKECAFALLCMVAVSMAIAMAPASSAAQAWAEGDGSGGGGGAAVPLYIQESFPAQGATGVPQAPGTLWLRYSHNVADPAVSQGNISRISLVDSDGSRVKASVWCYDAQVNFDQRQYIYITVEEELQPETTYSIVAAAGVAARNGIHTTTSVEEIHFTTGGTAKVPPASDGHSQSTSTEPTDRPETKEDPAPSSAAASSRPRAANSEKNDAGAPASQPEAEKDVSSDKDEEAPAPHAATDDLAGSDEQGASDLSASEEDEPDQKGEVPLATTKGSQQAPDVDRGPSASLTDAPLWWGVGALALLGAAVFVALSVRRRRQMDARSSSCEGGQPKGADSAEGAGSAGGGDGE